jgi:oligopeptide/dipeptide ABC transporter ATP-binding protein
VGGGKDNPVSTGRPLPSEEDRTGRPLLEVIDLCVSFRTPRGVVRAVDGVSLRLEKERTLGIVGESGAGKTVLIRSIMGLLPSGNVDRSGQILYQDRDLMGLRSSELESVWGKEIAMIFQDPMTALNPVVRLGRQITEAVRCHTGVSRRQADMVAQSLLAAVRVPEPARLMRAYPHQLSGGMRQRALIAMALARDPKLMLADEPTTALDVTVQAQILDLLESAQAERSMAMILVTHDLGVVAGRADEVAVMYAGRIVEQAAPTTLFSEMRMPYTEALIRSAPRLSEPSHRRLVTIPGRPPSLIDPPAGCAFAPRCAYVQPRCRAEAPPLRSGLTVGHRFACWYPVGTELGAEALARNAGGSARSISGTA